MFDKFPRLTLCLLISLALMVLAFVFRSFDPLISVTLYKAHLMSLGGWGGYWMDRAVFPYGRPHQFCKNRLCDIQTDTDADALNAASLRRAIIIAACLICVGMAA
jgi:hypothetical protein